MVALRKESVDRNYKALQKKQYLPVALRKESVDRNVYAAGHPRHLDRRSPQGERG